MTRLALAALAMAAFLTPAQAQGTVPNPLRAGDAEQVAEAKTKADEAKPAKPKRERSAKQKLSDDDMRACGARWRADKDALKAKGSTWRAYLKDCRASRKADREKA